MTTGKTSSEDEDQQIQTKALKQQLKEPCGELDFSTNVSKVKNTFLI